MVRGPLKIVIYVVSAILTFIGLLFMISSNLGIVYFFEGLVFVAVAAVLLFLSWERKPIEIKQSLTLSGTPTAKEVKCPNCGANVDPTKIEIIAGRPYVTCSYCSNKFELTEEPKW